MKLQNCTYILFNNAVFPGIFVGYNRESYLKNEGNIMTKEIDEGSLSFPRTVNNGKIIL